MQRHVALDLALQRMSGITRDLEPWPAATGGPSVRSTKLGPRTRVRVAVAALRGDMDMIRSLTTQRPSSTIGS
jgi:hypothetical protein